MVEGLKVVTEVVPVQIHNGTAQILLIFSGCMSRLFEKKVRKIDWTVHYGDHLELSA